MKIETQSTKFIKPFVPTPPTRCRYKLGFIDELVPVVNVSVVLFFSTNNNNNMNFIFKLEKSLEKTLTQFYPLAGKYVDENHTVDCNDQGVEFIYAKVDTKLKDIFVLDVDVKMADEFIPLKDNEPLLAIQVTMFECGGVAIGVNASHKIVDASTLCTFINEWAIMSREENKNENEIIGGQAFNSSSLFPGRGFCSAPLNFVSDDMLDKYTRKKVSFSGSVMTNMKEKITASGISITNRLSKVQLVSAILWKTLIDIDRTKQDYPRESVVIQLVNLRDKMVSLIPKNSCGNLFGLCATEPATIETTEKLVRLLNDSVRKTITNFSKADYLNSEETQMMVLNSFSQLTSVSESTNVVMLTSWCKFPFYEADFSFGKPIWVAPGSVPEKNSLHLMDDEEGNGVEAYIFLQSKDVPYFEQALDNNVKIYSPSFV